MIQSPGTVSKILWHFTGAPKWNATANKQHKKPKSRKQAYDNLKAIIRSCELRVGQYAEVAKLLNPEFKFSKRTRRLVGIENKPITLTSAPICCLADIPVAHLGYHAERYGKCAIGFRREAVIGHFNPVFYTLQHTKIIQSIYNGFSALEGSILVS